MIRKAKLKRRRLEMRKLTRARDKAEQVAIQPIEIASAVENSAELQK